MACVGDDGSVFERIPMVYHTELVGAITKGKALPTGSAGVTAAYIAQPPAVDLGGDARWVPLNSRLGPPHGSYYKVQLQSQPADAEWSASTR